MVVSLLTTDLASFPMTSEARMAESFFWAGAAFASQPFVPGCILGRALSEISCGSKRAPFCNPN